MAAEGRMVRPNKLFYEERQMVTATKEKPKSKKKKTSKPAKEGQHGIERDHDLPWNDKKVALFKALKSLKAVGGATNAKGAKEIAEKAGINGKDVRHYGYHAKAGGLVDVHVGIEGIHGHGFTLTAKGAKLDPAKELKEQEAAKASKE
jgi:hypothetical protein